MSTSPSVPARAWVVTFAGMAVNLCLGILYAWSVWKANLIPKDAALVGQAMPSPNEGWTYLTAAEGTWAYAICGFVFALFMIPGGRLQDRYGPKLGATTGGLLVAAGCFLAGSMKSYLGLILGFGILGGMGMGIGYAASTPAAVKWFGPHRRGLIVGLVVAGYGAAAIYISPLATYLIDRFGLSGSFYGLGILFSGVVIVAGQLLSMPPEGYVPPGPAGGMAAKRGLTTTDWQAAEMVRTPQFYSLVFLFLCTAQSGLLVIANAAPMLNSTARELPFFAANAWILASFGGLVNALGRVGTGLYSDRIGRAPAYLMNAGLSAVALAFTPAIMHTGNVWLLFLVVGVVYWQYGGGLALLPAFTADFFGAKNLGFNYGLVFLGWGIAFFVPQLAGYLEDMSGSRDSSFYLSAGLLVVAMVVSRLTHRPMSASDL